MLWCWLFGYKVSGDMVEGSFTNSKGEHLPGWEYFCTRCPTIRECPDSRNIWQRHVTIWLSRRRNLRAFAKLNAERKRQDPDGSKYLAQLSSYSYSDYSKKGVQI